MIEYFKKKYINSNFFLNYKLENRTRNKLQSIQTKITKNYNYVLKNPITSIERKPIPNGLLVESNKYFDKSITDDINRNSKYILVINYDTPNGIKISYEFYILSTNPQKDEKIKKYASLMTTWLITAKEYELDNCVQDLKVTVYLTNKKKELPVLKNHILGGKEVNTAFTYRCHNHNSSITMYREEDLMKVFFHETFHTFKFDFTDSAKDKIQSHYSINSDVNLFESYCETWARIVNSLFYAIIFEKKYNVDHNLVLPTILSIETLYSINQMIKIINYMGITFEEMIQNSEKVNINFKENSNVFSYYFITSLFVLYLDQFIHFCDDNINILNFNKDNLDRYVELIKNIKDDIINGNHKDTINMIRNNKRSLSTKMAVFDVMEIF